MTLKILMTFLFKVLFLIGCTVDRITPVYCDSCGMLNAVSTHIDVSSQLVNVKNILTVINNLFYPVNCFTFTIDSLWKDHLSYVEAQDLKGQPLSVNRLPTKNSLLQFNITFQNYILKGESNTISVYSIYTHYLTSFPIRSVKQSEQHLVWFSFNVYFYSDSMPKEQKTFVNIGANKLISVDGEAYSAMYDSSGYLIKYGPYFDIPTFSEHLSIIHYKYYNNKSPFLTVDELDRYILLSHWGYAKVWEKVLLVHSGPKFVGPYERPTGQQSVQDTRIESFTTILPKNAFNIYIKDDIGLVWSYDVYDQETNKTLVRIRPRFGMYGGWKTQYEMGYTIAISYFLEYPKFKVQSSKYSDSSSFNMEFYFHFPSIDTIFQHMVINKAQINVILPEGATFHDITYPYMTDNGSDINIQKYCYFFDIFCRQLISFKRYNLVEKHRSNFVMKYVYPQSFIRLLVWPVAISISLLLLFIIFILISRISQELKALKATVNIIKNKPLKKGQQPTVKIKKKSYKMLVWAVLSTVMHIVYVIFFICLELCKWMVGFN